MGKIDDVAWYQDASNSTEGLEHLVNGAHIGLFVKWCAINDLLTREFIADFEEEFEMLKQGFISIPDFVLQVLDGKLADDDFSLVGKQFADEYYTEKGDFHKNFSSFMIDYENISFGMDAESKFSIMAPILDKRFNEWQHWRKLRSNSHGQ